ncbi:hypothetical protein [Nonomuraea indica]|uniref:hypothetical protein n=1 Tax=Nonomuraea indica TaxID=1581193 RepID=UPI000C7A68C8|nr:hypothetical protein [Nonomuraea indica]
MTAGLESIGFGVLGVPQPSRTGELERHAGVLESVATSQAAIGEDGVRAHRLGGANAGAASDALDQHVLGKDGVLPRANAHAHQVSVAASVAQVAVTTIKWAGGVLTGLAGLAGLAALTPQGRLFLLARLRPFAQRVQQWIRTAMHAVGRIFTRLADLVRGQSAKARAGQTLQGEQKVITTRGRALADALPAVRTKVAHARISAGQARAGLDRAETQLRSAQRSLAEVKDTLTRHVEAVSAGRVDAATRLRFKQNLEGSDGISIQWRVQNAEVRLRNVRAQLRGHVSRHLDDAGLRLAEGQHAVRGSGGVPPELQEVQNVVSALKARHAQLDDMALTARRDADDIWALWSRA